MDFDSSGSRLLPSVADLRPGFPIFWLGIRIGPPTFAPCRNGGKYWRPSPTPTTRRNTWPPVALYWEVWEGRQKQAQDTAYGDAQEAHLSVLSTVLKNPPG